MIINKLTLKNFQLFKEETITFDKLNIISGVNFDDSEQSSNGSGKSTIISAIIFLLFGDVPGLNLKELLRIGTTEAEVTGEFIIENSPVIIKRKIPSELTVFVNGKELQANTPTLKQKVLEEYIGNLDYFKKFRTIDTTKGINLLDQGIISLRKVLMEFIDSYFNKIRQSLLKQKNDREIYNIDKRLYTFHLSDKRLEVLNAGLDTCKNDYMQFSKDKDAQQGIINNLRTEISSKEKVIYFKEQDIKKLNGGYCPFFTDKMSTNKKCPQLTGHLTELDILNKQVIQHLQEEIKEIKLQLDSEVDAKNYYEATLTELRNKEQKTRENLLKLKEAMKFKEYKYTPKDVMLYTESIKVLDTFSGYYINVWLEQLAIIINDILKSVNLEITFSSDKEFMSIKNGDSILKFDQLSSGQKIFLNSVFKLAILLHKGETTGLIVVDEGLSSMDFINLNKFLIILKTLKFQSFLIYQNIDKNMLDVNHITIVRRDGVSKINE
jgi:DNA repair exonuclease SbcCD ATPase subunit